MGNKYSNAQVAASPAAMSQGIANAFGDTEEEARKRKEAEDANAQQQAQQATGQEPSAWDTMKSMGMDLAAGAKDIASSPSSAYDTIMNNGKKKK